MTDLIEKIAEVEKHNMALKLGLDALVIDLDEHAEEDAQRILDVIKDNAGDLVRPLVWGEIHEGKIRSGPYCITTRENGHYRVRFRKKVICEEVKEMDRAKGIANERNAARVLSLLNLEVE